MRTVGSGYNQRITLEALIVVFIISLLVCFGVETLANLKTSAKLTEPMMVSMSVRAHNQIDLAFTGKGLNYHTVETLKHKIPKDFSHSIKSIDIAKQGHVQITLLSQNKNIDNKKLAFNLGRHNAGQGYHFFNWRCDNASLNNYDVKSPLQSTVAPIYTGPICRR